MNRIEAREQVFKLLYSMKIQKTNDEEQIGLYIENNDITDEETIEYIEEAIKEILQNEEAIREKISSHLKEDWTIDRLAKVDLCLLMISIYEMLYKKIPFRVSINEAVELAKKYGEENCSSFINGILASVVKKDIKQQEG